MHPHSTMDAGPELDAEVDRRLFGHTGHGYYGPPTDPSVAWAHELSVRYDTPDAADAAYRAYYEARYPTPESRHGVCAPEDLGFDLCYWQDGWGPRCTWSVVAHFWSVTLEKCDGTTPEWTACITARDLRASYTESAATAPLAICLAALATLDHAGAVASQ
jgi:hypothetical protein